jgi:tRNA-modifying protein YgfZ
MPQFCPSTDYVCIEVRGADAGSFLAAQLSRTPMPGVLDRAPLAGWHDARGRVRALFRVWPLPDRWLLGTPRDGAEQLLPRLRMFVLRAAVTLAIADDPRVAAVVDADRAWVERHGLPRNAPSGAIAIQGEVRWLCVGPGYWQALGPSSVVSTLEPDLKHVAAEAAALAEIGLGLPSITPALADRFVAQTLNLDALDALAFDKGCYPGQEIIARVHNLGDVKRRARRYAATTQALPAVGAPVFAATGAPIGEVVRSAPTESGCELLAVVDHAAGDVTLTVDGTTLRELPLPFPVPRD